MRLDLISVMPRYFESFLQNGIVRIAQSKSLVEIVTHNLHDYGIGNYQQVDDSPFGGGSGMIIMCEPVFKIIERLKSERVYDEVIYLTPDGEPLNQSISNRLSLKENLILLCGHYKGIDERIRETLITKEISIGDFVLSGGEPAAMVLTDSIVRLLPGVMTDIESALLDSFQDGKLDTAHYTRPAEFRGMKVPEVLLSGNHKRIEEWRQLNSLERTKQRRPDLLQ
ncbi:MAG: tRNA (guanosine(37)-N1)-methyltransferase TrmD [Chloroherpetonaceae bacterium]|nr:tRNA (guanosine(37)-N1)-methyltransferase TrmD [Chloroherpetonaceae bacterium]